tara:strand:+ start:111 stop:416 length:306 start_codon:yes stop_codon:yes gene_type:complete
MAKTSAIQRNLKRIRMAKKFNNRRKKLKAIIKNRKLPLNERFEAQLKLSKLPKNSAKTRIRNRCEISGRPHGVYRKLKISRIALRQMASAGKIPGMTKSSW